MTRSAAKSSTHTEIPLKKIPKPRKNNKADNISWLVHCHHTWMKDPGARGIWQTLNQGDQLSAGYWALRAKVRHGRIRPADLTELVVGGQGELQLRPDLYPLYEEFLLACGIGPIFGLTYTEIAGCLGFAHTPSLTPTGFWTGYEQHIRKQLAAFERHNILDRPNCALTQLGVMATEAGELKLDETFALWEPLLFRTPMDYELLKQACSYDTFLEMRRNRREDGGVQGDVGAASPPAELSNEPSSSTVESGTKGGGADPLPGMKGMKGISTSPTHTPPCTGSRGGAARIRRAAVPLPLIPFIPFTAGGAYQRATSIPSNSPGLPPRHPPHRALPPP